MKKLGEVPSADNLNSKEQNVSRNAADYLASQPTQAHQASMQF